MCWNVRDCSFLGGGEFCPQHSSFRSLPLCGAALCGGTGLQPPDRPCLPCDILILQLDASDMKRAVAEAQQRYFCSVWNVLFSCVLPELESAPLRTKYRRQPHRSRGAGSAARSRGASGRRKPARPRHASLKYNLWSIPSQLASTGQQPSPLQYLWPNPADVAVARPAGSKRPRQQSQQWQRQQPAFSVSPQRKSNARGAPPAWEDSKAENYDVKYNSWGMPLLVSVKKNR